MIDLFTKDYLHEDVTESVQEDIADAIENIIPKEEFNYGILKGKIRVQLTYIGEDGCDCRGFQHKTSCLHNVIAY